MEWNTNKLSSIAKFSQGKQIPIENQYLDTNEKRDRFLRIVDFTSGFRESPRYVEVDKKYHIDGDEIIMIRYGTPGKVYRGVAGVIANNMFKITFNENILDKSYGYWFLKQKSIYDFLMMMNCSATMPAISFKMLDRVQVQYPSLPIQRKIASILSTYDNLIENNTKRIKLLELMAENLYKEWFVRFRFPGHENVGKKDSKLGKIPTSFDTANMESLFEYYIGGGWGNEEKSDDYQIEASVIRGADFPSVWHYDVSTCPRRYHKTSNYKARQLEDGDIVMEISGGTAEQPVGRTVLVTQDMIDRFEGGKVICASFCKLIRLKKNVISPYYFYYWMHYLWDTRIIDRFQLQSTGIINFKFEPFLKKGIILMPPKKLMEAFEKHVIPIYRNINSLAKQNEYLTKQRDLLLPRLMSGKLKVKP